MAGGIEYIVYRVLRFSIVLTLIVIIIGLILIMIYTQAGLIESQGFRGAGINMIVDLVARGDPRGLAGLSVLTLIGGVLFSIVFAMVGAYKVGDRPLFIVSLALIMIILISAFIGLYIKAQRP
jgi:hypothetical protein